MILLEVLQHLERLANPVVGLTDGDLNHDEYTILFAAFLSMTDTINQGVEVVERLEAQIAKLTEDLEEKNKIWTP